MNHLQYIMTQKKIIGGKEVIIQPVKESGIAQAESQYVIITDKTTNNTSCSSIFHNDHKLWCCMKLYENQTLGPEKKQTPLSLILCKDSGKFDLCNMDALIQLIGYEKCLFVYNALQSITDECLKKKAIAALMTRPSVKQKKKEFSTSMEPAPKPIKTFKDVACMTIDLEEDMFPKVNVKKHKQVRKRQRPYVVEYGQNLFEVRKTVIDPFTYSPKTDALITDSTNSDLHSEKSENDLDCNNDFDKLSIVSNIISKASLTSLDITPSIINDADNLAHKLAEKFTETVAYAQKRLNESPIGNEQCKKSKLDVENSSLSKTVPDLMGDDVHRITEVGYTSNRFNTMDNVAMWEGLSPTDQELVQGVKPEDWFHLITPERMKTLSLVDRKKLIHLQMYIDTRYCLETDEDNYLPIHNAVLNNDMDLLKRQLLVLKAQKQSIDIGDGEFNYSALQLCVVRGAAPALARHLLRAGASPLAPDDEERSALHHAAEAAGDDYLQDILRHMANHSREILQAEQLWFPALEEYNPEQLTAHLFRHALSTVDKHGYTPLMLAARLGRDERVYSLLECAPELVNYPAPNSGCTALYLAAESACLRAESTGEKSKIEDHFAKTLQYLVRYGADPWIENKFGGNVNSLLCEFQLSPITIVVNNALSQTKLRHVGQQSEVYGCPTVPDENQQNFEPFILIKTQSGLLYEEINKFGDKRKQTMRMPVDKTGNEAYNAGANKVEKTIIQDPKQREDRTKTDCIVPVNNADALGNTATPKLKPNKLIPTKNMPKNEKIATGNKVIESKQDNTVQIQTKKAIIPFLVASEKVRHLETKPVQATHKHSVVSTYSRTNPSTIKVLDDVKICVATKPKNPVMQAETTSKKPLRGVIKIARSNLIPVGRFMTNSLARNYGKVAINNKTPFNVVSKEQIKKTDSTAANETELQIKKTFISTAANESEDAKKSTDGTKVAYFRSVTDGNNVTRTYREDNSQGSIKKSARKPSVELEEPKECDVDGEPFPGFSTIASTEADRSRRLLCDLNEDLKSMSAKK